MTPSEKAALLNEGSKVGYAVGCDDERKAVVAWLREGGANVIASEVMKDIANAIESGDHLKGRRG